MAEFTFVRGETYMRFQHGFHTDDLMVSFYFALLGETILWTAPPLVWTVDEEYLTIFTDYPFNQDLTVKVLA